jgi:uncharacterized protein DUF6702
MTILLTSVAFLIGSFIHPFHVSVCEIEHDIETKALQISQRVFLDDLEETLNHVYGIQIDIVNPDNNQFRDSLVEDYILKHLIVTVNGKHRERAYLGHEIEKDVLWSYIEYYGVKKMKTISITNTVFFELYDDQNTIIHMKHNGTTKSKRVTQKKPTESFEFNTK